MYPKLPIPPMKTCYVLQAVHAIQGSCTAGNEFFELSTQILQQMGMVKNAIDNAVFTFRVGEEILIFSTSASIYYQVRDKSKTMFELTTQEGSVIKVLNSRIISSDKVISLDQTKHILDTVEQYFPKMQHWKKANTPMRTASKFEEEYADATPPPTKELKDIEVEFGGSYLALYGKLLLIATVSRPQISNALSRLGKFQALPYRFAFVFLLCIFQYLASNPNVPIFYPKLPLSLSISRTISRTHDIK